MTDAIEVLIARAVASFAWPVAPQGHPPGLCLAPGCPNPVRARGMCRCHYDRWCRSQSFDPVYRSYGRRDCREPGCDEPHCARGYCARHYNLRYKAGEFRRTEQPSAPNAAERIA